MSTQLVINGQAAIHEALKDLHDNVSKTNWVLMKYQSKFELAYEGKGEGGLEEVNNKLPNDQIKFAVVEVVVKGDDYNPVKFVLITWLGKDVPPGLSKARASGHRVDLLSFCKEVIPIAAEYEVETHADLSYDSVAQKLTKMRARYHSSEVANESRQEKSRSAPRESSKYATSTASFGQDQLKGALESVYKGQMDWAILAYSKERKDTIELKEVGKGSVDEIKKRWPADDIFFTILAIRKPSPTGQLDTVTKYALVTLVGDQVSPLKKARSSAQRRDVIDFALTVLPFHCQVQPDTPADLTEELILSKLQ